MLFGDNCWLLTCMERFLNSSFHEIHPHLCYEFNKFQKHFSLYFSLFSCCISNATFNSNFDVTDIAGICRAEAIHCCALRVWSSFLCICALVTVYK